MHTLIYGAGAVGGYFGARLHQAGAAVTFLARGTQLTALAEHGLRLNSVDGDYRAPSINTVARLADAPPADLVLLCVKGHDTPAAARDLAAHLPPHGRVVCLQNGLGHLDILAEALGRDRVIPATVFIGARVTAPGVIHHSAAGFVRAGKDPEGSDPEIDRVVGFLADHGVAITASPRIRLDMWKKLLWNLGFNGPSALSGATVGQMTATPGVAWLIRGLIAEAVAVGRANGMNLPDELVTKTAGQTKGLERFKTSMLQDVEAGRAIENDAFYGHILRIANGCETPLTQMMHDTLALRFPPPASAAG